MYAHDRSEGLELAHHLSPTLAVHENHLTSFTKHGALTRPQNDVSDTRRGLGTVLRKALRRLQQAGLKTSVPPGWKLCVGRPAPFVHTWTRSCDQDMRCSSWPQ